MTLAKVQQPYKQQPHKLKIMDIVTLITAIVAFAFGYFTANMKARKGTSKGGSDVQSRDNSATDIK